MSSSKFLYGVGDRRTSLIDNISELFPLTSEKRLAWDKKYVEGKDLLQQGIK